VASWASLDTLMKSQGMLVTRLAQLRSQLLAVSTGPS
jgi:hypothetical protein